MQHIYIQSNTKTCGRRTIMKLAANGLVLAGDGAIPPVTVLFATSIHRTAGMGKAYWVLRSSAIA